MNDTYFDTLYHQLDFDGYPVQKVSLTGLPLSRIPRGAVGRYMMVFEVRRGFISSGSSREVRGGETTHVSWALLMDARKPPLLIAELKIDGVGDVPVKFDLTDPLQLEALRFVEVSRMLGLRHPSHPSDSEPFENLVILGIQPEAGLTEALRLYDENEPGQGR